ncbi:MAG: polyphosphate polymerase domain-containing protein [Microthrixaceae bacterium]|nr:polyphosphate polymerase domain-containing protein [Microthrixaceae bacterium]
MTSTLANAREDCDFQMSTTDLFDGATGHLQTVTLDELNETAELQSRMDRKYIVDKSRLADVIAANGTGLRVLEIDDHRGSHYTSTYFDTPDLVSYMSTARSRPTRFKVRTRRYGDAPETWLEVKQRSVHGKTIKERIQLGSGAPATVLGLSTFYDGQVGLKGAESIAFLNEFDTIAPHVVNLSRKLTTAYTRMTLLCSSLGQRIPQGQRVTIDCDLRCGLPDGSGIDIGRLGDLMIIETKSPGHGPGPFDRALWSMHIRPIVISKYALGMASSDPTLPSNKWHRVLSRYVRPGCDKAER